MDNKKVQTLDGEIMLVQEVPCQVKLNDHQWTVAFSYHKEPVSLKICKEDALPEPHILVIGRWKVEEFLEDKRKQDFRNYLNGVSGNRA